MKSWRNAGARRMSIDHTYPPSSTCWGRNWRVVGSSRTTFTSTWGRWRDSTRTRMHWRNLDVKLHCLRPWRDDLTDWAQPLHWPWARVEQHKFRDDGFTCTRDRVLSDRKAWGKSPFPLPPARGVFDWWPHFKIQRAALLWSKAEVEVQCVEVDHGALMERLSGQGLPLC